MRLLDDLHLDEGDGGAMIGLRCDPCRIESSHSWVAADANYEAVFGHRFGEDLPDDEDPHERAGGTSGYVDPLSPDAARCPQPLPAATRSAAVGYEQAVTRLIAAADDAAEYRADLASFADTLAGKRWGNEVTGRVQDMDGQLAALEGEYRDLAGQMKHQGDQGAAAHEQAPWVPADDSILA